MLLELVASLMIWYRVLGTVAMDTVSSPKAFAFPECLFMLSLPR